MVKAKNKLPREGMNRILIRGTNWIGDAVMTLPTLAAVRQTYPHADIALLAKPWVSEVYRLSPDVDRVVMFEEPGLHEGIMGKFRLAAMLKMEAFDMAILLQNAIEAAIIAWLAAIPVRAGYDSDARRALLTHPVHLNRAVKKIHQTGYYLELVKALGCLPADGKMVLRLDASYDACAETILNQYGIAAEEMVIGIAPGAAYGPAKRWFPEGFATAADRLADELHARIVLFGSEGDRGSTETVKRLMRNDAVDIAGTTNLREAIAVIGHCGLFISNDSGLMHVAAALDIPTVAIFGSTNPITTSPVGDMHIVVKKAVSCSPCLKPVCPTDFSCMTLITPEDVYSAALELLASSPAALH